MANQLQKKYSDSQIKVQQLTKQLAQSDADQESLKENVVQLTEVIAQKDEEQSLRIEEFDLEIECLRSERDAVRNTVTKLEIELEALKNSINNDYVLRTLFNELNTSKNKIIDSYKATLECLQTSNTKMQPASEPGEQTKSRVTLSQKIALLEKTISKSDNL